MEGRLAAVQKQLEETDALREEADEATAEARLSETRSRSDLANAQTRADAAESAIVELKETKATLSASLDEAVKAKGELDRELQSVRKEHNELKNRFNETQQKFEDLKSSEDTASGELAALKTRMSEIKGQKTTLVRVSLSLSSRADAILDRTESSRMLTPRC